MDKVKTSVSLDKDVYEYIQRLAEEERTNVSQIINRAFLQKLKDSKAANPS